MATRSKIWLPQEKKNGHSPVGKTGRHTPKDKNGGNNEEVQEKGQGQEVPNEMMKEPSFLQKSLSGKGKGRYGRQT